jgi:hypothetical protein
METGGEAECREIWQEKPIDFVLETLNGLWKGEGIVEMGEGIVEMGEETLGTVFMGRVRMFGVAHPESRPNFQISTDGILNNKERALVELDIINFSLTHTQLRLSHRNCFSSILITHSTSTPTPINILSQ